MRRQILLTEIHRIRALLVENRIEVLQKKYLDKIKTAVASKKIKLPRDVSQEVFDSFVEKNENFDEEQYHSALAQRVFNDVMNADPDPVKKNTQWLLTLLSNNRMPYEDLPKANDYLTRYAEKKKRRQIPQEYSDLNRFRSLGDLFQVVKGSDDQIQDAQESEKAKFAAETKKLLDNSELLVFEIQSEWAAQYIGRDTEWCTAWGDPKGRHPTRRCYYNHYANTGPLFVIIHKASGEKWQFHFEEKQFMDVDDRQISTTRSASPVPLIKKFPILFKVFGDVRFVSYIDEIGIKHFSEKALEKVSEYDLARAVNSLEDFNALPEEMYYNIDLYAMMFKFKPHLINEIPIEYYGDHLEILLNRVPMIFKNLPKSHQTTETAELVAKQFSYQVIESDISKELWTPEIYKRYWESRTLEDRSLHVYDIPKEFLTDDVVVRAFINNPEDMSSNQKYLTKERAESIVFSVFSKSNPIILENLPKKFMTQRMFDQVFSASKMGIERFGRYPSSYGVEKELESLKYFPSSFWTEEYVKINTKHGLMEYGVIPDEHKKNPEILENLIKKKPQAAAEIPDRDLRPIVRKVLNRDTVKHISPRVINPEDMIRAITEETMKDWFYRDTPKELLKPEVMLTFMKFNVVPVKDMPRNLITEKILATRTSMNLDEMDDIPSGFKNEKMMISIISQNYRAAEKIEEKFKTEPVLNAFVQTFKEKRNSYRIKDDKETFESFPKKAWSSRVVSGALQSFLIEPLIENIPNELLDENVASMLISRNPENITKLPRHIEISEELILESVEHAGINIIENLTPQQVTADVALAIIKKFSQEPIIGYDKSRYTYSTERLEKLPRDNWDLKCYAYAVGRFINLKEVPSEKRNPKMVALALMRDVEENAKFLRDPAKWLNKNMNHVKTVFKGSYASRPFEKEWQTVAENAGMVYDRKLKEYYNAKDAEEKVELRNGAFATVVQTGSVNKRVFVYDKNGKLITRMFTKDYKINIPNAQKIEKKFRNTIAEAATKTVETFDGNDLGYLEIYGSKNGFQTLEKFDRFKIGKVEVTRVRSFGEDLYILWNGNKKAITMHEGTSNAAFGRSRPNVSVEVFDKEFGVKHSSDIYDIILKFRIPDNGAWQLQSIGLPVMQKSGMVHRLHKRIKKFGDYVAWFDKEQKYITLTKGKDGAVAQGIKRKNSIGNLKEIGYNSMAEADMQKVFGQVERYLNKE